MKWTVPCGGSAGQDLRRTEQHGGMAVMPAGMHLSWNLRCPGSIAGLRHRQCIHIGPQTHAWAITIAQRAHDTGAGDPFGHHQPQSPQPFGDDSGRAGFFEPEFRVGMQIAPHTDQIGHVEVSSVD